MEKRRTLRQRFPNLCGEFGFGAIPLLAGLVVLAAVSFAGWYVYDQNKDVDTNDSNTQQTNANQNPDTKDPIGTASIDTSDWYLFEGDKYSMRIPDGWKLVESENGILSTISPENLKHSPGKAATVGPGGGTSGYFGMLVRETSSTGNYPGCDEPVVKIDSTVSVAQADVVRCEGSFQYDDAEDSTFEIQSWFIERSNTVGLRVHFATNSPDGSENLLTPQQIEVIEAMLSTVEFK